MGHNNVLRSQADVLYAYLGALERFVALVKVLAESGRRIGDDPETVSQVKAALSDLENARQSFLAAGVQLGCDVHWLQLAHAFFVNTCSSYVMDDRNPKNDPTKLFPRLVSNLKEFGRWQTLDDLIALAEAQSESGDIVARTEQRPDAMTNEQAERWLALAACGRQFQHEVTDCSDPSAVLDWCNRAGVWLEKHRQEDGNHPHIIALGVHSRAKQTVFCPIELVNYFRQPIHPPFITAAGTLANVERLAQCCRDTIKASSPVSKGSTMEASPSVVSRRNPFRQLCELVLQIRQQELQRDLTPPHSRQMLSEGERATLENRLRELVADCWVAGRQLGDGREREAEDAARALVEGAIQLLVWEAAVRLRYLTEEEALNNGGPCVALTNRLYPPFDLVDHLARLFDRVNVVPPEQSETPKETTPKPNGKTDERTETQTIERKNDVLRALLALRAVSERRRVSRTQVARKVDPACKPSSYYKAIAALVKEEHANSLRGPGAGIWLTSTGIAAAQALTKPREKKME